MVGVYVRVSSTGQNIEGQTQEIQRWLDGNGIEDAQWFIDKATGTNLDRPAFEQIQRAIFDGQIKTVVIWRIDRLSRSLIDGINVICDWVDRGIRIVATSQQIDFSGPTGKLIASVLLGLAELENQARRSRQMAGIKAAKERGTYLGRQKGTFKGNPRRVLSLREKGLKDGEIATALGISRSTVLRYARIASQSTS